MIHYLLDTNVLSEPVKPQPNLGIMARIREQRARIATAAPVWHELLHGCYRLPESGRRAKLETYLREAIAPFLRILPYDDRAADRHAMERARLSLAGRTPPLIDSQIAAVAQVHELVLVTRNVLHFSGFEGLRVEDWAS